MRVILGSLRTLYWYANLYVTGYTNFIFCIQDITPLFISEKAGGRVILGCLTNTILESFIINCYLVIKDKNIIIIHI
jgi:hypothetical protein